LLCGIVCALADVNVARAQASAADFDPAAYRGRVLYLDFWASWCAPCQASFPYMGRLVNTLPSEDFALVAVNVDHDRSRADAFLHHFGGSVPVVFDPAGALAERFDVKAMPTSLLIGRDGRTRYVHSGFHARDVPQYDAQIRELINEG